MWQQVLWGSFYLCLCLVLETLILVWFADALSRMYGRLQRPHPRWRTAAFLLMVIACILFAHTVQVWIWSAAFVASGAIAGWNTSVYFSLATYTTLGYGDVVLDAEMRIFAAFAAVNGLLGFGISTAFLVSAAGQMFTVDEKARPRR